MKNQIYTCKKAVAAVLLLGAVQVSPVTAQVTLTGTSYTQNFDGMGATGTTTPAGWSVSSDATATALGTLGTTVATNGVATTTGAFNNYPNGSGRCLGLRQTASFANPGAAFVLAISGTVGKSNFQLSLDHVMASAQPRVTEWTVQYSVNGTAWTSLGTYSDPTNAGGVTPGSYSIGSSFNNVPGTVYIRVVALASATGTGNRDSYAIDNVVLSWTNAASCAVPAGLAKSSITDSGMTLTWNGVAGTPDGYEYAVTNSATPPASGTSVTDTFVNATGLAFNTKYYVHLRTQCSTSSFSSWTTDSAVTSLPVELISLSAKAVNSAVEVKWSTAQELNNKHFEIERSEDGKTFRRIGTIKGKGTYTGISNYAYYDNQAAEGSSYYRLRQVDFDGSAYYSGVVSATIKADPRKSLDNLAVNPNPAVKGSKVHYALGHPANVNITIYNVLGQPVYVLTDARQEAGSYAVALPELKTGVYFVKQSIGQYAKAVRIIVE